MFKTFVSCFQHSGRFYEELPNTADYVSYRLACNKEDYPEPYSPPINPPLSFLPQQPYQSPQIQTMPTMSTSSTSTPLKNTFVPPSHSTTVFKYPSVPGLSSPPPGVGPYTFPKEQYVWRTSAIQTIKIQPEAGGARGSVWSALSLTDTKGQRSTNRFIAELLKRFVSSFVLLPAFFFF